MTSAPAFAAALEWVRARFPLPPERVADVPEEDLEVLLTALRSLRGGPDAWGRRAILFPRRALSLLFPTLLHVDEAECLDRIGRILEARATVSLHDLGWAWFQHHFADERMAGAFRRLHDALLRKDPKGCPKIPPGDGGPVDATLPARIHAAMKEAKAKFVGPYFEREGILPGAAFERAILVLYFSGCADDCFVNNEAAFARMLRGLDAAGGAAVLGHYLREHRLGPRYRLLNTAILDTIGAPDSGAAAWTDVPERSRARFWKWLVSRTVEDHLVDNPRKYSLLQRYVPYMESVRPLGDGLLVMGFGSFYLVDDRRTPDVTSFYEKAVFELWLEQLVEAQRQLQSMMTEGAESATAPLAEEETFLDGTPSFLVPSLPAQPAKRVILEAVRSSAVLVDNVDVGLLFAKDFLDDVLGIGRRGAGSKDKEKGRDSGATPVNRLF